MTRRIDISYKTVIFIAIFILAIWVTYLIRDLLIILFVAVILTSALSPLVGLLTRFKLPKSLSIAVVYLTLVAIVASLLAIILPPLVEETRRLFLTIPPYLDQLLDQAAIDKSVLQSQLSSISGNAFSITLSIFSNLLTIIFLLVLTFYLLLEREDVERRLAALFVGKEEMVRKLIIQIEEKLGGWLRGQLFLSLIIGVLTYIGLLILGIPYALPLAVIAGILEVVPTIGPIISAIPSVLIALTLSPVLGIVVGVLYFAIQQLENHLIVPQVMKRAVGLNPLIVILAIAIGGRLLGVAGALLAVPMAVVIQIIATEIIKERKIA
ncbi:AI-2E family transporter [Candidatus Daviesbacteria bacterium]|nr:AI-2E family transporter [Candidatus Daviesbacteria bacterium]